MAKDPELRAHEDWLGLLQPVGLVVSPPALASAQAEVDRAVKEHQDRLRDLLRGGNGSDEAHPPELLDLVTQILGWQQSDIITDKAKLADLTVVLEDYDETLVPDFGVPAPNDSASGNWMILGQILTDGVDFDDAKVNSHKKWQASAQIRMERLLWEREIPIGLLYNGRALRLTYVPRGETSGHVTFPLEAMTTVAGRLILSALRMLLGSQRLFTVPVKQRLPAILIESRKYQNVVSTALADQVLSALQDLLGGFQAANEHTKQQLLAGILREDPQHIYGGLLATLLRLVFVLYAEDRGLLPDDSVYQENYSVTRLFEKLRADAAMYPDTMDQRYGAWAQLLSLFRLVFDGAEYTDANRQLVHLPPRQGDLFNPDVYPFLEGRPYKTLRVTGDRYTPPRVSDGVVWRVLERLLLLNGQRLSYRALDVEQIGSVYEALMGFELREAAGPSLAVRPKSAGKGSRADVVVNVATLLEAKPKDRVKVLLDDANCELGDAGKKALEAAKTVEEMVEALGKKISKRQPGIMPAGSLFLQPTEERRRSGSHYTPRSLTEPIVRKALEPIFAQLGKKPTPEQILELKVCDPAMGSGAFLVEACRQLAQKLVEAWTVHRSMPQVPPDEDPLLHARRIIAQRCLYGVDKNPFAVDLAKLSLWLATLARDHAFTFLDHSLRHGDSLVGLSRAQITAFNWEEKGVELPVAAKLIKEKVEEAVKLRRELQAMGDSDDTGRKRHLLKDAEDAIADARLLGDLVVAAFFGADKDKERHKRREAFAEDVSAWLNKKGDGKELWAEAEALRSQPDPISPFHWEVEFPEVFANINPGFDCFVGNPPFLGGTQISEARGMGYFQWLVQTYPPCEHHCDLVAYFFRRAFSLLRERACFGLIATKTIKQGDTREGGLRVVIAGGGQIYEATRRLKWPGEAAVIVSVVHVAKKRLVSPVLLDGDQVSRISAYLVAGQVDESPVRLAQSPYFSLGSKIYGQGFLFADDDPECTPIAERMRILKRHPDWADRVPPYLVGEEITSAPTVSPGRFVISLSDVADEAELATWPDLERIVREKVRPERLQLGNNPNNIPLKKRWWAFQAHRPELYAALDKRDRALCISRVGQALAFAFAPTGIVYSEAVVVFDLDSYGAFAQVQSRVHEAWARFFASSMKDDLRYTPSDCFETFPFANTSKTAPQLETAGKTYYDFRASLMADEKVRADLMDGAEPEGLTKTYNRFHDPDERLPGILKLRELHDAMDRAVLDAYGWHDIKPKCEFILDYEEDEDDDDEDTGRARKRKKPWRYRWPDEIRDEVLARLLELNAQRAAEEKKMNTEEAVAKAREAKATHGKGGRKAKKTNNNQGTLL